MKRYVAALLVVVGVVGLLGVLAVGRGFAEDEKVTGAKCSEATLEGTYLFAQNGVQIKGNDQRPFALAAWITGPPRRCYACYPRGAKTW